MDLIAPDYIDGCNGDKNDNSRLYEELAQCKVGQDMMLAWHQPDLFNHLSNQSECILSLPFIVLAKSVICDNLVISKLHHTYLDLYINLYLRMGCGLVGGSWLELVHITTAMSPG